MSKSTMPEMPDTLLVILQRNEGIKEEKPPFTPVEQVRMLPQATYNLTVGHVLAEYELYAEQLGVDAEKAARFADYLRDQGNNLVAAFDIFSDIGNESLPITMSSSSVVGLVRKSIRDNEPRWQQETIRCGRRLVVDAQRVKVALQSE